MQGVREARERQSVPRIGASVEPPRPKAVPREQARQRWYTPAQDYDGIRNYESASSSSYRGLGTDSEKDAGILQHLQSRPRQRRDRESAGVYEAERSERDETEAAARRAARARKHRSAAQRLAEARASEHSIAGRSRSDSGRARGRDKSAPRRFRELRHRDTSGSSVESNISGRKRRDVRKTDEGKNKVGRVRETSHTSSSATDPDSEVDARERRKYRSSEAEDGIRAGKLIRSWGMKFNGSESRSAAEEFFEQLNDCRVEGHVSDQGFLSAISCAFKDEAARWFRMERERMRSWKKFAKMFKDRYVGEYGQQDFYDDLRRRSQGKGEKVKSFLLIFRYIVSRFKKPPSVDEQVDLAYRNLLPEYRRAMSDKVVDTIDDIKSYGKRFENQKAIDGRYVPPPPADKMHVPSAAFTGVQACTKVAAVEEEVPAVAALKEPASTTKKGRKAKKREGKSSGGEASVVDVEEVLAVQQGAPVTANQSSARGETYAAVVRGRAPPRDIAYPRRDAPVDANTPNAAAPPTEAGA